MGISHGCVCLFVSGRVRLRASRVSGNTRQSASMCTVTGEECVMVASRGGARCGGEGGR